MTKTDYIAIAKVLDANHAPMALVCDMAMMLEEDNPRFDRAMFIKASTKNLLISAIAEQRTIERATR